MPLSIVTPTLKCIVTGNIELSPAGPSALKVRVHTTRVSDIMLQTRSNELQHYGRPFNSLIQNHDSINHENKACHWL